MADASSWKAMLAAAPPSASGSRSITVLGGCWKPPAQTRTFPTMTEKPMLLIVDDEKPTREGLRAALEDRYDIYLAEDAKAAIDLLEREHFAVLLTEFRLPNEDGMRLIARARSLSKPPICILMTAYG